MKRLTLILLVVGLAACVTSQPPCREMTWHDPTGGQAPTKHLGAEEAVLWTEIYWATNKSTQVTTPVATPCGDQLPCAEVAKIAGNMGKVTAVERCSVRWLPQ